MPQAYENEGEAVAVAVVGSPGRTAEGAWSEFRMMQGYERERGFRFVLLEFALAG